MNLIIYLHLKDVCTPKKQPEVTTISYVTFVLMSKVVKTVIYEATLIEKTQRVSNCLAIS